MGTPQVLPRERVIAHLVNDRNLQTRRILIVADARSIHTRRWVEYFLGTGAEVHVASGRFFQIPGATVHVLPRYGLGKLGYFFATRSLRRLHANLQPDVVHAHHLTSYGFLAAFANLHPLIVTAWGSDVLVSAKESRLLRYLVRYAVLHADVVTTVAEHMNSAVAELGIPSDKIIAIPFGVDTKLFVLSPHPPISPASTVSLICTRALDTIYDVETLLRATAAVVARGRKVHLELVGDGPLRRTLSDLSEELNIATQVTFHGRRDSAALAHMLASADIFISPAHSDGNNVSLNEAMACGCFPIATSIPANRQWIRNDSSGYLYTPGDVNQLATAIEKAIDNPEVRARARTINRTIVEADADWRVCTKRVEEIYRNIARAEANDNKGSDF